MQIKFVPIRADHALALERDGETLIINGARYDFAPLPEGAELPKAAIASTHFCGPARRESGILMLDILCPHGRAPTEAAGIEHIVEVQSDGPIALPVLDAAHSQEQPS